MSATLTIPAELRERPQWVLWRYEDRGDGKPTKVPYRADDPARQASSTDPATWATYEQALKTRGEAAGIGYVFSVDDPFVGVDLDDCIDETGELSPATAAIVRGLDSYTERTPSGRGLHIILRGHLSGSRRRAGNFEVYSAGRYFTVTGERLGSRETIEERQGALDELLETMFPPTAPANVNGAQGQGLTTEDDRELLERAFRAKNGPKLEALYRGEVNGYPSSSEADLALCSALAFWTGPDAERLDRLFRASGLMREKWDSGRGESTYGAQTVERALARAEFYEPRSENRRASVSSPPRAAAPAGLYRQRAADAGFPGIHLGSNEKGATAVRLLPGKNSEPPPVRRVRRRFSFAELLDLPEPGWLIRGLVPQSSLTVLYGAPGSGKTFVALDWALSVATGQRWLGHEVTPGAVAFIAAEGVGGLPKRVRAWREEHGEVSDEAFAALSPGVNLLDRADMGALRAELRDHRPKLIVVDTLARCLIGGDENSARDVGQAIAALDELRAELEATVLVVHHAGKGEESEERGSSALRGAADAMFKTAWDEDRLMLTCSKQKDAGEAPDLELELEPRESSCVVVRSAGRSGPTPSEARLLATLVGFGEDGAFTTALMDAAGLPKTTFYRTLNGLVDRGDIERQKAGTRTRYIATAEAESHGSTEVPNAGGTTPGAGTVPLGTAPRVGLPVERERVPQGERDFEERRP